RRRHRHCPPRTYGGRARPPRVAGPSVLGRRAPGRVRSDRTAARRRPATPADEFADWLSNRPHTEVREVLAMAITMRVEQPLSLNDVRWAVTQAGRAPSIHNTQPWRFRWDGSAFELRADTTRGLTVSDPDGRELVLSCGAALYNLRLALAKLGHRAIVTPLPDRTDPRLLARVEVAPSVPADAATRLTFAALLRRHTHRGAFDDRPLAPDLAVALQRAADEEFG